MGLFCVFGFLGDWGKHEACCFGISRNRHQHFPLTNHKSRDNFVNVAVDGACGYPRLTVSHNVRTQFEINKTTDTENPVVKLLYYRDH